MPLTQHPKTARWVPWVICLVSLIITCLLLLIFLPDVLWDAWRGYVGKDMLHSDYIQVNNQPISGTFYVKSVRLSKPGFVVLVTADWYISPGDLIIGRSLLLPVGESKDVPIVVTLLPEIQGTDPWQSMGYAMLMYDNGDGKFDIPDEIPAKDNLGDFIEVKIKTNL